MRFIAMECVILFCSAVMLAGLIMPSSSMPERSFWGAMTMSFKPPAKGLPPDLKVGDRVSFSFAEMQPGSYQIESITMLEQERPAERKP